MREEELICSLPACFDVAGFGGIFKGALEEVVIIFPVNKCYLKLCMVRISVCVCVCVSVW